MNQCAQQQQYLQKFVNDWATDEIAKSYLKQITNNKVLMTMVAVMIIEPLLPSIILMTLKAAGMVRTAWIKIVKPKGMNSEDIDGCGCVSEYV